MILATLTVFYLAAAAAAPPDSHDSPSGAATVFNYSFEADEDRDFRGDPDDWTRRKGPGFPTYVDVAIDRTRARTGSQSLWFAANGGQAVLYSPPIPIDSLHSYVFRGCIRTQLLENDAALVSISFLNHRRQRVQRFLTRPVTGTHQGWVAVAIEPVTPRHDVRFVVLGCHLLEGAKMDIRGSAWFDDLWLGKLPQLSLVSNFHRQFIQGDAPIQIESIVSGLDPGQKYRLLLEMKDSDGKVIASDVRQLESSGPAGDAVELAHSSPPPTTVPWELPPQEYGFYHVRSVLERDGLVILEKQTSFAVMDLVDQPQPAGEFGWSISGRSDGIAPKKLIEMAKQAGINWIKYPLWQSVYNDDRDLPARITGLLDGLNRERITPVGLLNDPPPELRAKFARDWSGVSEIFTMQKSFWAPSLQPVIARYSSNVRHWQLGGDDDGSFVGLSRMPETLAAVKSELDRIGRDTRIGVHWDWNTPLPTSAGLPQSFLSVDTNPPLSSVQLVEKLGASAGQGIPRWVLLKPLPKSKFTPEERGADLVKRMVAAKIGRADAIFAYDVFDEEYGLLNDTGSPTRLFLPWRTTALALQQAEFLGSFNMPGGSTNYAFARDNKVVLVIWNESEQPVEEEIFLGDNVVLTDIWGRHQPLQTGDHGQRMLAGAIPLFVHGCSEPIARWQLAVRFEFGQVRSAYEAHREAILGKNTFKQGVSGTISLSFPREWEVSPPSWTLNKAAGEDFRHEMLITLPPNASLGVEPTAINFDIVADRQYRFRVLRPYQVGLGDVVMKVVDRKLKDGRLEVEQLITNNIAPAEVLDFRCTLFVPGHKRQTLIVTKLSQGDDKKLYYLPEADSLRGKELWLRAEQVGGRRVLNYRWMVGENWDKP